MTNSSQYRAYLTLIVVHLAWSIVAGAETPSAQDDTVGFEIASARVGKYHRAEFRIVSGPLKGNPYDADEVDVSMELAFPGGKELLVPAFYHQSYERRDVPGQGHLRNWLYPVGAPTWRARSCTGRGTRTWCTSTTRCGLRRCPAWRAR